MHNALQTLQTSGNSGVETKQVDVSLFRSVGVLITPLKDTQCTIAISGALFDACTSYSPCDYLFTCAPLFSSQERWAVSVIRPHLPLLFFGVISVIILSKLSNSEPFADGCSRYFPRPRINVEKSSHHGFHEQSALRTACNCNAHSAPSPLSL